MTLACLVNMKRDRSRDKREPGNDTGRTAAPAPEPTGGSPVDHTGDRDYLAERRAAEGRRDDERR